MKHFPLILLLWVLLVVAACQSTQSFSQRVEAPQEDSDTQYAESLPLKDFLRRVPGVQVTGSGENVEVRVRGLSTISGDPSPLFVVDGVELGNSYQDVAFLDGNQIDKIRVLKDATSTSQYGFRGSYGVIVIKTKN